MPRSVSLVDLARRGVIPQKQFYIKMLFYDPVVLMAAWGYTFGIAYMSFFGQLRSATITDPSGMPVATVIGFKGIGMALAAICLALAWPRRER
jgi:hypothetical protein